MNIIIEDMIVKQHPVSESMKFEKIDEQLKIRDREVENADK